MRIQYSSANQGEPILMYIWGSDEEWEKLQGFISMLEQNENVRVFRDDSRLTIYSPEKCNSILLKIMGWFIKCVNQGTEFPFSIIKVEENGVVLKE